MIARYLWEAGSVIIGLMGLSHLRATLWTNKLFPRNAALIEEMKKSSVVLTEELTMWKAWMGFNATHSSGAMFIGITNFYLALTSFTFLQSSQFLLICTLLAMVFYVWVAAKYWMKIVLGMLSVATACFIVAYILMMMNKG